MDSYPRISLDQWRALVAVVDAGGYAQAALEMNKSQSSITYAVQAIESLLDVKAFEIRGRKAHLTPLGQMLYRRARLLLSEAGTIEHAARTLAAGWESEIRIAAEIIFPTRLLLHCLDLFGRESPQTRIEVIESVLGGTPEAITAGQADIAITPTIPVGFLGEPLVELRMIAVAHPQHPLHQLQRPITLRDLTDHRHLVVRDTGTRRTPTPISVEVDQRWTMSHVATSVEAACEGYGFAWFAEERIGEELASGRLKPLPLREGAERFARLYLVIADPESAGPGTLRLAQLLKSEVPKACQARRQTARSSDQALDSAETSH